MPNGVPHVGGPVTNPGQTIVRVTGRHVAVVGGQTTCTGMPGPDPMVMGSPILRIMGSPVVRITDMTSHGGQLVVGSPIVRSA
ncbi:MAG: PAAR domain-containing protein [Paracoccaceae bacterium]